jgi:hypothetical protein
MLAALNLVILSISGSLIAVGNLALIFVKPGRIQPGEPRSKTDGGRRRRASQDRGKWDSSPFR